MRNPSLSAARMHRVLAALLPLLLFAPTVQAHPLGGSFSVGRPGYVNFLLDHFTWPDLAPGESGAITFFLNNTYPYRMRSIVVTLEIFRYADLDRTIPVDANWTFARPNFYDLTTGFEGNRSFVDFVAGPRGNGTLDPGEEVAIAVGVVTDAEAPHGSLTNQGSYFVRTAMEFDLTDGTTTNRSLLYSLGHFTAAEFDNARGAGSPEYRCPASPPPSVYCEGTFNLTYLGSVKGMDHIDGISPEGGFSVKDRMPLWPYVAVGGVMVASFVFAFLFYAEENPGKYPRVAMWWMAVKGKVRGLRPRKVK